MLAVTGSLKNTCNVSPKNPSFLKGFSMFKGMTQRIILGVTVAAAMASNAAAAIVLPLAADIQYTSVELAAGLLAGVLVTVLLIKKAISFFR